MGQRRRGGSLPGRQSGPGCEASSISTRRLSSVLKAAGSHRLGRGGPQGFSVLALCTRAAGQVSVVGAVLCVIFSSTLASTHEMPAAPPCPLQS